MIISEVKQVKDIKIFLASSSELKEEREQVELFIGRKNKEYRKDGVFLDLVIWEELEHSFHSSRIQDRFNEKLLECDILICLFFTKVGKYTKEEFIKAFNSFKEDGKPRHLYVFFKNVDINSGKIDENFMEIINLKRYIEKSEQMYNSYTSNEDLLRQIEHQFNLIVPQIIKSDKLDESLKKT